MYISRVALISAFTVLSGCNFFAVAESPGPAPEDAADAATVDDMPESDSMLPPDDVGTGDVRIDDMGVPLTCGDGQLQTGEGCDLGDENSDQPNDSCRTDCTPQRCGDGIEDGARGEQCDDGNLRSHDGCSSTCLVETPTWRRMRYPFAVSNHAMVYDPDRDVVILFGGMSGDGETLDSTWEFDGTAWTVKSPQNSPSPRFDHRMVWDSANNRALLFGGHGGSGVGLFDDTWVWDGNDWTQLMPASSPPARSDHGMAFAAGEGATIVHAGEAPNEQHSDTWAFDGTDWRELSPTGGGPGMREEFAMSATSTRVFAHGGIGGGVLEDDLWELDLTVGPEGRWTLLDDGGTDPVRDHVGLAGSGGTFAIFGGSDGNDTIARMRTWTGTMWEEAPQTTPWPTPREAFAITPVSGGVTIVGGDYRGEALADVWYGDPNGWELVYSDHPTPRDDIAATYHGSRGSVFLYGGDGPPGELDDTWELASDASRWTRVSAESGPGLWSGNMTYDSALDAVVHFGGRPDESADATSETWLFSDGGWARSQPMESPPERDDSSVIWDTENERTLMTGGCPAAVGTTVWSFDGTTWAELAPDDVATACRQAATFDAERARLVYYTSIGDDPQTYEFDGASWLDFAGLSPATRTEAGMAFDLAHRHSVLFGGYVDANSNEVWEFDGSSWLETTPDEAPVGRNGMAFVYDPVRRAAVMFGGRDDPGHLVDTWLYRWENEATPEETCDNGDDDDSDGAVDCVDPDCQHHPTCAD